MRRRTQAREFAVFEGDVGLHHAAVDGLDDVGLAAFLGRTGAHARHDGLDALLVAHLVGVVLDARGLLVEELKKKVEPIAVVLLLPMFFTYSGLNTRMDMVNSPMLPGLIKDPDGGVTIYLQTESPGPNKEANWLPAPEGPFQLILRLYWPKEPALDGEWKTPQAVKQ